MAILSAVSHLIWSTMAILWVVRGIHYCAGGTLARLAAGVA
jgi:hypothetical protein